MEHNILNSKSLGFGHNEFDGNCHDAYCINGHSHNEYGFTYRDVCRINGRWHNEVGFAFEYSYYIGGKRHNENGVAVKWWYKNGSIAQEQYFIDGEILTKEELARYMPKKKEVEKKLFKK